MFYSIPKHDQKKDNLLSLHTNIFENTTKIFSIFIYFVPLQFQISRKDF